MALLNYNCNGKELEETGICFKKVQVQWRGTSEDRDIDYGARIYNAPEVETNIPTILGYNIEEIGEDFAIFSFEGNGEAPDMTIYTNLEPQGTHINSKVDIIPTKVLSGEITLEEAYSRYAGKRL